MYSVPVPLCSHHRFTADELGAVVAAEVARGAADRRQFVQHRHHILAPAASPHLDRRALPREIIQHHEQPLRSPQPLHQPRPDRPALPVRQVHDVPAASTWIQDRQLLHPRHQPLEARVLLLQLLQPRDRVTAGRPVLLPSAVQRRRRHLHRTCPLRNRLPRRQSLVGLAKTRHHLRRLPPLPASWFLHDRLLTGPWAAKVSHTGWTCSTHPCHRALPG